MTTRRDAVLREMGLAPVWRLRGGQAAEEPERAPLPAAQAGATRSAEAATAPSLPPAPIQADAPIARAAAPRRPASEHAPQQPAPSIPAAAAPRAAREAPGSTGPARVARIAMLDWDALEADIRACAACVLCERRKQAVPGVGDRRARWMLVGEAPGAEEDQRGEPFVGQAGRLLDNMLAAIGMERGRDVYIANAVKCRPPHNRTPERAEIAACTPYLERQIELIQPRLLVALGRPAAQALLEREVSISAARGKRFERNGIAVVVTYHPAYLLRNPQDKAKAWEDLCFARRMMAEVGP